MLAQIVIAMASHAYLHLEGGEVLVEFIVRHSAIRQEDIDKEEQAVSFLYRCFYLLLAKSENGSISEREMEKGVRWVHVNASTPMNSKEGENV